MYTHSFLPKTTVLRREGVQISQEARKGRMKRTSNRGATGTPSF